MRMEWLPSRSEAFQAEVKAIRSEAPAYNLTPAALRGARMAKRGFGRSCMVPIDPHLHRQLKELAARKGQTMGSMVDDLVAGLLAKEEAKAAKAKVA